jgi:hypothetical protein
MKNVISTSSLYSWNSDCNADGMKGGGRRAMGPICELDFESRLCFNSRTLPKQNSVDERMNKNDFVVDYEKYKLLKRNRSQQKLAKSLKNCFENEEDKEVYEQISLRSKYGSKLIASDLSVNEHTGSNKYLNETYNAASRSRNNFNYCSKTSLSPSIYSNTCNNRLTVNNNSNNNATHKSIDLNDKKFHSSYSLVSNNNNNKLSSLTADYKINYNSRGGGSVANANMSKAKVENSLERKLSRPGVLDANKRQLSTESQHNSKCTSKLFFSKLFGLILEKLLVGIVKY